MSVGITLDTGALIALERRSARISRIWHVAVADGVRITVPTVVVGEWWRGRSDRRDDILMSVDIEPLELPLARLAGEAIAAVPRATLVDAVVVASAARRGDLVFTSEYDDLTRLAVSFFNGVKVFAV
jgi:hypothetical protein